MRLLANLIVISSVWFIVWFRARKPAKVVPRNEADIYFEQFKAMIA
jgi:hypothetical protein